MVKCPVEGCGGRESTGTNLRTHFVHLHVWYKIVIMEEGNPPHPRCPARNMFVTWLTMKNIHPTTALCAQLDDSGNG